MGPFRKKVKRILQQGFPEPASIELRDEDRIIGTVVSPKFRGMDSMERITQIWDLLDQSLTPEERRKIVTILAITPEEKIAHSVSG
jgi:hypothetical protein